MRWEGFALAGSIIAASCMVSCQGGPGQSGDIRDDQIRAAEIMKLGDQYAQKSHDSALYYYRLAGNLYSARGDQNGLAESWYGLINRFKRIKEYDSAKVYIEKYIDQAVSENDSMKMARGYFQLGSVYTETNYHSVGLNYFRKSLALFSLLNFKLGISANLNYMGSLYKSLHQNDSAARYYTMALELCESEGDEKNAAIVLNHLGGVLVADKQYDLAFDYYQRSLEINLKYPELARHVALNYNGLGILFADKEDFGKAKEYYTLSYELSKELNDTDGILDVLNNLGGIYIRQKEYDLAMDYFFQALNGYRNLKYNRGILVTSGNIASVYFQQGKYEQARALNDSILGMAFRVGDMDLQMDAYQGIAETYAGIGNFPQAYENIRLRDSIKDIIYDLDKTRVITDLYLNYEKGKAEARILNLEKENLKKTLQRNSVMYSALGLILLIVFVGLYLRQRAVKDKIIARQKIRQLEEEKKLMAAKMLVEGQEEERKRIARELHDGLGVLLSATKMQFTTIRDLSPENRPLIEKAQQLLEQASGDVRRISHNMMPGLLTKLGFYEAVEDLFENLDEMENLNAAIEIEGEPARLSENREIMLYRVVQELINNTLKHAGAGNIGLKINVSPSQMQLIYRDDGKGFDVDKMLDAETGSFGLKNILSRINFLNGEAEIKSKPGEGVVFFIRVPVA